jgi:Ca2+-binding RTX toxin-like protein
MTIYSTNADSSTPIAADTAGDVWIIQEGVTLATSDTAIAAGLKADDRQFIIAGNVVSDNGFGLLTTNGSGTKITINDTGSIWGGTLGMNSWGNDTQIVNEGSVYGKITGLAAAGQLSSVVNRGDVSGGVNGMSIQSAATRLINSGSVDGEDYSCYISSKSAVLTNLGTFSAAGDGIRIDRNTLGESKIVNAGTIDASTAIVATHSIDSVTNTGEIFGSISLGEEADTFTNSGQVTGGIDLGSGADVLKLFGSSAIAGSIAMGADNDTVIVSNGTILGDIDGGAGDDLYDLRQTDVTIVEVGNSGTDTVKVGSDWYLGDNFENLILTGNADTIGHGNTLDNTFTGNRGDNQFFGGRGTDILNGGAGADRLDGGADLDTADYRSDFAEEGVYIDLSKGTGSSGDAEGDRLFNIENVTGSLLDDTLRGSAGDNILTGSSGSDALDGRGGYDLLNGGAGSDAFIFSSRYGHDAIEDFTASGDAHDVINLSGLAGVDSFRDLKKAHMAAVGDDVVITGDRGETLTLMGVELKELSASDFLF